ncbi:MAG: hypothetical protein ACKVPJ_11350 [Chitinophagales bacterium]
MKPVKILSGSILLSVFLFYTSGVFCFYHLQGQAIKKEHTTQKLKEKNKEELTILHLALKDISWVEEHEFYFDSKLYDLVSFTRSGDSLTCVVYHDEKEQKLKEKYNVFAQSDENEKKGNHNQFKSYPKFQAAQVYLLHFLTNSVHTYPVIQKKLNPVYIGLISPPPES